jgi:arsenite-transporting ATPase
MKTISDVFTGLPQLAVRHRPEEPLGLAALREVGRELYPEVDPLARMAATPALEIVSAGRESVLRLFVPGASRDEIEVEIERDELIVTLGSHRRTVKLPDGLSDRSVERAGLRGQHLEVVFGEVCHA